MTPPGEPPCDKCGAAMGHRESPDGAPCVLPRTEALYEALYTAYASARLERDAYLANLTSVQARCTELLEELRRCNRLRGTQ